MRKPRARAMQPGVKRLKKISTEEMRDRMRAGLDYGFLEKSGIKVSEMEVPFEAFEAFLAQVDYDSAFTEYVADFTKAYEKLGKGRGQILSKFYEQFLSVYLTHPGKKDVTADIAAGHGPLACILKKHQKVKTSYHQDLNAPSVVTFPYLAEGGIEIVTGNAAQLPFEDDEISYMYVLNSWGHFQAPSDLTFLQEAARCLKPGGKVLIIPLNGVSEAFVRTDPSVWATKQVYEEGTEPRFRKSVAVEVAPCGQVYAQYFDAKLLAYFAKSVPDLSFEVLRVSLDEPQDFAGKRSWDILVATRN